jgi:hypothetical protein
MDQFSVVTVNVFDTYFDQLYIIEKTTIIYLNIFFLFTQHAFLLQYRLVKQYQQDRQQISQIVLH